MTCFSMIGTKREATKDCMGLHIRRRRCAMPSQICVLTEVEQDIIVKHMWPLTLRKVPKYRESFVVSSADKICALAEMLQIYRLMRVAKKLNVCCSQA